MSKSKRGRPVGQTNRKYEPAIEIPAACPACHGTKLKNVRGTKPMVQDYAGEVQGLEYDRVIRRRKQCANEHCGQFLIVRTYEKRNNAKSIK